MRAAGRADPGDAIRFHASAGLGFVAADVAAVAADGAGFALTTGLLGLTGPSGVLPRPYTELVNGERRRRAPALGAFLDLLAQRPLAQFLRAGIKYRPHRLAETPADGMRDALLALVGHGLPGMAERLGPILDAVLFHAGSFAIRPRSAERLGALLSDWLGQAVTVEQFAGHWLRPAREERTALPARGVAGRFHRLGVDAAAGARCWDIQSRVVLRIGPMEYDRFRALMPGGAVLPQLMSLARTYLGMETGFAVRPVLAAAAVPPLSLGARQLGRDSWLPRRHRTRDADEALFAAGDSP